MYRNNSPKRYDLITKIDELVPGTNVFSLQVHNKSSSSSDLTAIAYLTTLSTDRNQLVEPPIELDLPPHTTHTNFRISSSGENITLYKANGEIIDRIATGNLHRDVSIGVAIPGEELQYFEAPTPGMENTGTSYLGLLDSSLDFSSESGFITEGSSVFISGNNNNEDIRYTTCLLYTSPSPRDATLSRMPSSA